MTILKGTEMFGYFGKGLPMITRIKITKIAKKTTHPMWKKVAEDDILKLVYTLKGKTSGKAPEVEVFLEDKKLTYGKTAHIAQHLERYEFEILSS